MASSSRAGRASSPAIGAAAEQPVEQSLGIVRDLRRGGPGNALRRVFHRRSCVLSARPYSTGAPVSPAIPCRGPRSAFRTLHLRDNAMASASGKPQLICLAGQRPRIACNGGWRMMAVSPRVALAIWLYLLFARGGFWLGRERDDGSRAVPPSWPRGRGRDPGAQRGRRASRDSIGSLLAAGLSRRLLASSWSTTTAATAPPRSRATPPRRSAHPSRLTIVDGARAAGRLDRQAVGGEAGHRGRAGACRAAGLSAAHRRRHRPCAGRAAPAWSRAPQASGLVLTSLMVKLRCESFAERACIPAFIFFFQMLYPFAWVNRPRARDGGARRRLHAGARATRCAQAGGIEAIRDALIDDCALAQSAQGARARSGSA